MEMKTYIRESVKLSLFIFFLLFLSGRLGLLLHEFAGHALSWQLLGGKITDFKLFLFGGGWVYYGWTPKTDSLSYLSMLYVQISGIVVELAVGSIFAFIAILLKTTRLAKALFSAASSVFLVHGLFYLVICTYYGCGDGGILFDILSGNVRHGFLIITSCLTVVGAFIVSFTFSPVMNSWVVDCHSKKKFFLIILSVVLAGLLHGSLTVAEKFLVNDRVYDEIQTSMNDRLKQEELTEFIEQYDEKHGREADQEEIDAFKDELAKKYKQFQIEAPLLFAVFVAFLAGFLLSWNRNYSESNPIKWKDNCILGSVSALTVVLLMSLNAL